MRRLSLALDTRTSERPNLSPYSSAWQPYTCTGTPKFPYTGISHSQCGLCRSVEENSTRDSP